MEVGETFMNKYAVGPQQASNSPGTSWWYTIHDDMENKTTSGEYKFRFVIIKQMFILMANI